MMKKFSLIVCGSFVGSWLAMLFFTITAIVMSIAIMIFMDGPSKNIEKNSILHIHLNGTIPERDPSAGVVFLNMLMDNDPSPSLESIMKSIQEAKNNENIKGIYIECDGAQATPAMLTEIRNALSDFRETGKFIYAYGNEGLTQGDFYLASTATKLYLNPVGVLDLHGLASQTMYYKNLLDKVGVEMQVVRVGSFKSAVEPYMLSEMSEANREQQEHYLGSIWGEMSQSMAADRGIDIATFNQYADSLSLAMEPEMLVKNKLVDELAYRHDVEAELRKASGIDEDDDLRFVTPTQVAGAVKETKTSDEVAVLYAVGEIDGSDSTEEGINSEKLCKQIYDLAKNKDVKALVIRVNSPGGSAFGSEQIWKAVEDFKATGKPVAVSMGGLAASGGYYISCNADRIFALPTTITGSIGIFGVIPCVEELVENKLGVKTEIVKTNDNGDFGAMTKRMTPYQLSQMQNIVNRGYELFTQRCADGRGVSQDSIKTIAEGRVWDGATAKKIGLVDEFGSLNDAVRWAANEAGLSKYKRVNYPTDDMSFNSLFKAYATAQYKKELQGEMGMFYQYYDNVQHLLARERVLCIMEPTEIW